MTYNVSGLAASANPGDLVVVVNNSVDGALFGMMSVSLFFIFLLVLRRSNWEFIDSLMSSSFAMFVITAILSYGKLVSIMFPLGFLVILAFAGLYSFTARQ